MSGLAEHTRNLAADPRAGFLVVDAPDGDVLNAERATLLGRFVPLGDDPHVTARYCRYEPDAARYLALGDFTFWALDVERLRYIGGFGRMGWVDGTHLDTLPPLAFDEEQALWDAYDAGAARRDGASNCSASIATAPTGDMTAAACVRRSIRRWPMRANGASG